MTEYTNDSRIVLTLDAGGTNMVFGAMRGGHSIVEYVPWYNGQRLQCYNRKT